MNAKGEPDVLVVASIRRWVADDFADPARRAKLPLLHSWGMDVPNLSAYRAPAWWTTTEHAARVRATGTHLPLLSTGPTWLAELPTTLTGRTVWAGTIDNLLDPTGDAPRSGWAKPAEAKVPNLPAAWWDSTADFVAAARRAGLPASSWVQVSPTRLDISEEHRAFVLNGEVLTTSPYLLADGTTWHEGMTTQPGLHHKDAGVFASDVTAHLGSAGQPPAYTLDVALTADGKWLVLEGNPAWSSAAYGATMDAVLAVTLAASDHAQQHPRWSWRPDPWLLERAQKQRQLRVC